MQKINPIFLVLLLVVVAIFVHIKKENFKTALVKNNIAISKLNKELEDTAKLKNRWLNSYKKLNSILNSSAYKGAVITKEDMKNGVVVKIEKLNSSMLRGLLNKILNSYILLKKISIKKDNLNVSLIVEIEK
jgi:hypothetical protein